MFRSTQLRILAVVFALAVLILPLTASATPFDSSLDHTPKFEQRYSPVQAFWQVVIQTWLKVGHTISPDGKD